MHRERFFPFFVPTFVLLLAFVFAPLVYMIVLSLTNASLMTYHWKFVAFRNLVRFVQESVTPLIISNTAKYVVTVVIFQFGIGFMLALLLDSMRAKQFIKGAFGAILFVPWVFSDVIAVGAWKFMFNDSYGMINYYVTRLGLKPVGWFSDPNTVLITMMLLIIWKGFPFSMVLEHAGMQTIPLEVREAAKMDGAGFMKTLRYITLPMMKYIILSNLVLITILTFNAFSLVYASTHGDPIHHSEIIGVYMYNEAFKTSRIGYAAFISVVMTLVSTVAAVVYLVMLRKKAEVE